MLHLALWAAETITKVSLPSIPIWIDVIATLVIIGFVILVWKLSAKQDRDRELAKERDRKIDELLREHNKEV